MKKEEGSRIKESKKKKKSIFILNGEYKSYEYKLLWKEENVRLI